MRLALLHRRLNKIRATLPGPTIPEKRFNLADLTEDQRAQFEAITSRISTRLGTTVFTLKQVTDEELDELEAFALSILTSK